MRLRAEEGLDRLAWDLQYDRRVRARVEAMKEELLANPAMQRWIDGLWEQARGALLGIARDPEGADGGHGWGISCASWARRCRTTAASRARSTASSGVPSSGVAADYGDGIVRLVSETVRGWDARTITRRLENAVGRDLQYIRVNGTIVGGLVGLTIHAIDLAL